MVLFMAVFLPGQIIGQFFECRSHDLRFRATFSFDANLFEIQLIRQTAKVNLKTNTFTEEIMKKLDVVAAALLVIGGLNWGLVAAAKFDLVATIFGMHFGETSALSSAVYGLVGLAAIYHALSWKAIQRRWNSTPAIAHSR
jgi:uncharacterized protein